jgi:hypothetical protein
VGFQLLASSSRNNTGVRTLAHVDSILGALLNFDALDRMPVSQIFL